MRIIYCFTMAVFMQLNAFSQAFTLDQSFVPNYNFDVGKYTFGMIYNTDNTLFLYGDFSPWSLTQQNAVKFDTSGNLQTNFLVTPGLNETVNFSIKTDYGYLLQLPTGGFRKIDEFGNDIMPNFQSNIASSFPSGLINFNLESYHYSDGRILSGCENTPSPCTYPATNPTQSFYLYRLLPDGIFDTTFNHSPNGGVLYVKGFSDSAIFVCGKFTTYDGAASTNIVKIDSTGARDTTFQSIFSWGFVYPAFLQDDGKIIITGSFLIQGMSDTLGIVRILPDGQLDTTFNNDAVVISALTGIGYNTGLGAVCRTTDNGYLIGGVFDTYDGLPRGNIVKTDGNGFVDPAYFNGTGIDSHPIPALGIEPSVARIAYGLDGNYYITGWFNGFNGQVVPPFIRLRGLTTGIQEYEPLVNGIRIYPNPSSETITIETNNQFFGNPDMIIIYDSMGRLRQSNHLTGSTTSVDISHLENGMYCVYRNCGRELNVKSFTIFK